MILPRLLPILHYWPAITCVWFTLAFVISYFISISNGHVYPYFPFISDTGSVPPESCIFGQMLNIGAVLMAINVYIRYRQVNFAINSDGLPLRKRWNIIATFFGAISCLGISVVANFQETALLPVHVVGALMIFGSGALFLFAQTRMTFAFRHIYNKNPDYWIGPNILYLRIILTICFCFLYSAVAICGFIAVFLFTGTTIIWWTEEHGGYQEHLAAAISEWILVVVFYGYMLSFTQEFKSLEYEEVRFKNKCINPNPTKEEMAQPNICVDNNSHL